MIVHSGSVPTIDMVTSWFANVTEAHAIEGCCSGGACGGEQSKAETVAVNNCSSGNCSTDVGANNGMSIGAWINLMAGSMILLGLLLAHLAGTVDMFAVSWLWLPVFVGLNLFQFAFTGFCPAKMLFEKMGVKKSCC